MLVITKDTEKVITITSGAGDNLTTEDIKNGYVDYIMSSIYKVEGEDIILEDAGQILSQTSIDDMDEEDLVHMVMDYWGVGDDDYVKGVM